MLTRDAPEAAPPGAPLRRGATVALGSGTVGVAAIAGLVVLDGNVASGALAAVAVAGLTIAAILSVIDLWRRREAIGTADQAGRATFRPSRSSLKAVTAVIGVTLVASQSWFATGKVIAGGDIAPPVGTAWLHQLFDPWTWNGSNLGGPNASAQQLPWAVVVGLVHSLGGSGGLAQRIWLTTLFVGAAVAAYVLLRVLGFGPFAGALGALVFMFNPCTLSEVGINAVYLAAILMAASLPAIVVAVGRKDLSVRGGVVALILCAPFIGYSYQNPPLLLMLAGTSLAGVAAASVLGGRPAAVRCLRLTAIGGPLLLLACLYWLVPSLVQVGTEATTRLSSSSSWTWTEGRSTLPNALWLNTEWGWKYPAYYPYAPQYARFPLAPLKYLLPLAAFGALPLGLTRRAETLGQRTRCVIAAVGGLALFVIVLSTGTRAPGDVVFDVLYRLPLGWLLREPGRFLIVTALCYAVLVAATAEILQRWWQTSPLRRHEVGTRPVRVAVAIGVTVVAMLAPSYPLAFGQIASIHSVQPLRRSHVQVPTYWTAMAGYLNHSTPAGPLLVLPPDDNYQMPYTWGYYGNDEFITDLLNRETLVPSSQGYGAVSNQLVGSVESVATDLTGGHWVQADNLLAALGTPFILVRGDIVSSLPQRSIISPALIATGLAHDPDARLLHTSGPLKLYEVEPKKRPVHVVTVDTPQPDLAALSLFAGPTALVTAAPMRRVPNIVQPAPVAAWRLEGDTLSTQVPTSPQFTYRAVDVAPDGSTATTTSRAGASHFSLDPQTATTAELRLRTGPDLLTDGTFSAGLWQTPVRNCDAVPGVATTGRLSARIVTGAVPGGTDALAMTARVDTACEARSIRWTRGPILVSMMLRQAAGTARLCIWEVNLGRCAPDASPLPSAPGWTRYQTVIAPEAGTTKLSLFLYADSDTAPGGAAIEFGQVGVHVITLDQPLLLAQPRTGAEHLKLLETAQGYDAGWSGPGRSRHVLVDGLRNGWLTAAASAPASTSSIRYRWSTAYSAATLLSGLGALGGALLWLSLGVGRLRRRKVP